MAGTQRRSTNLTAIMAFVPDGNGEGLTLTTSGPGVSTSGTLVGTSPGFRVCNRGPSYAHLALGTSGLTATTAYLLLAPGVVESLSFDEDNPFSHAAILSVEGVATVNIVRGTGI